jgi:hypothetical protein
LFFFVGFLLPLELDPRPSPITVSSPLKFICGDMVPTSPVEVSR